MDGNFGHQIYNNNLDIGTIALIRLIILYTVHILEGT